MPRNPSRVVTAMTTAPVPVGGIVLRDLTAGTYLVLQRLNSPLVTASPGTPVELSDLDAGRLIYILSRPAAETYTKLQQGMNAFDAAVVECLDGIGIDDLPKVKDALREKIGLASSTAPSGPDVPEKKTEPEGRTTTA